MRKTTKKVLVTGIVLIMIIQLFTGCSFLPFLGQEGNKKEELMLGCIAQGVETGLGPHVNVCDNGEKIFYCDGYSIYMNDVGFEDKSTSQEIVSGLEYNADYMCSTNDKLFYTIPGEPLHVLNLNDFTEKKYFPYDGYSFLFKDKEDVYLGLYNSSEVYCFTGDDDPVKVDPDYDSMEFVPYIDGDMCFQINGKQFKMIGTAYSYGSQEERDWKEVLEIGKVPGFNRATITREEKGAYCLCRYGENFLGENPRYGFLVRTALFYFDADNEKTKLIYANKDGEQIGAYSVEKQEIYVLRNGGIYSIDFNGKNEKKLYDLEVDMDNYAEENNFSNNKIKRGTEIIFEVCGGKVFVYYEESSTAYLLTVL